MVLIPFQEEVGKSVKRSTVIVGIAALNAAHNRRSSRDVDHVEEVCFESPAQFGRRLSRLHDAFGLAAGHVEPDTADHKVVRREKECLVAAFFFSLPVASLDLRPETERPSEYPCEKWCKRGAE